MITLLLRICWLLASTAGIVVGAARGQEWVVVLSTVSLCLASAPEAGYAVWVVVRAAFTCK